MNKDYTQSTATLKTVVHDTFLLDAQKIMIYPGEGDKTNRVDLTTLLSDNTAIKDLSDSFEEFVIKTDASIEEVQDLITETTEILSNTAKKNESNVFTSTNTFEEVSSFEKHVNFGSSIETDGTVKVNSGDVILNANGSISFDDDGLVTTPSGAKGYPYSEGIPTILRNGGIYNLGIITEPIDISGIYFDGDDTIIQTCEVWFEQGSTVNAITWMPDLFWIDTSNGNAPTWLANLRYRVAIRKEIDRLIGSVSYSYSI